MAIVVAFEVVIKVATLVFCDGLAWWLLQWLLEVRGCLCCYGGASTLSIMTLSIMADFYAEFVMLSVVAPLWRLLEWLPWLLLQWLQQLLLTWLLLLFLQILVAAEVTPKVATAGVAVAASHTGSCHIWLFMVASVAAAAVATEMMVTAGVAVAVSASSYRWLAAYGSAMTAKALNVVLAAAAASYTKRYFNTD
jgi:hypothetical protein